MLNYSYFNIYDNSLQMALRPVKTDNLNQLTLIIYENTIVKCV